MKRTAEFVSPKHPDKICDRISDALLDEYLSGDKYSRCAIETCGGHGMIYITGEVTSSALISEEKIRGIVKEISGIDNIIINIVMQSPEIAQGVDIGGAGDQGIMIGYACRENNEFLPQEYYLARNLNKFVYESYPYDGKTQITLEDEYGYVSVVCSFQNVSTEILEEMCTEFFKMEGYIIKNLHCNPAGNWNIGGLDADTGLTGRKLVVDNYGPRIPIGGGSFSGKDATKVDRSAAYMARKIAVDYLETYPSAEEVYVELSYAIGYDKPIQATVIIDGEEIEITDYDLSPLGIIDYLNLREPIYSKTSEWGHMGNNFNWK